MIIAAVMIGMANTVRNATTVIIQVNTGMRISVMPGARMLRMVTMKLIAGGGGPDAEQHDAHAPEVRDRCPGSAPPEIGVLVSGV